MSGVFVPAARSCVFLQTDGVYFDAAGQMHAGDIRVFMATPVPLEDVINAIKNAKICEPLEAVIVSYKSAICRVSLTVLYDHCGVLDS